MRAEERDKRAQYLHGVQGPTSALRVELYAPNATTRIRRRLDPFHRRIVTIDEKWLPPFWEWVLKSKGILMILAATLISRKKARREEAEEQTL